MSIACLIAAILIVLSALVRGSRMSRRVLLGIALLLPPIGLLVSGTVGDRRARDRIDVQFVGMRLPASRILPCGASTPLGERGIWIGGGTRRAGDRSPDVVALPGYRPRLIELCRETASKDGSVSSAIVVRAVSEGKTISGRRLIDADGPDTQRVVLSGPDHANDPVAECLIRNGQVTRVDDVTKAIWSTRRKELASRGDRGIRGWLRDHSPFSGLGELNVYCADLTTAVPVPCGNSLAANTPTVMMWGKLGISGKSWSMIAPRDAEWCACDRSASEPVSREIRIDPPGLDARETWGAWRRTAARVTIRMINRRSTASIADQTTIVPAGASLAPPAFWLGREYVLRVGTSGSDLILMLEEPSVQLRLDDLFGGSGTPVLPDGVFDVTFDAPQSDELLVADLAASADHLLPKPAFASLHARVTIPESGDEITVAAGGRAPQRLSFGEVFTLPVREAEATRPMLVIRRVQPPLTTYVLPFLAALLLLFGLFVESNWTGEVERYWLVIAALSALLQFRFALATRDLVNGWSTDSAVRVWIQDGAWLLAAPALLVALVWILRRRSGTRVTTQVVESTPAVSMTSGDPVIAATPRRWASAPAPAKTTRKPRFVRLRATARRFVEEWPAPLLWILPMIACALLWAIVSPRTNGERLEMVASLGKTALAMAAATSIAWWLYRRASKAAAAGPRLLARALIFGGIYVAIRLLSYFLGSQEQVFGMRVDVLSLPAAAALLAAFTHYDALRGQRWRAIALAILWIACFGLVAVFHNDFGLLWLGAMAIALALPATFQDSKWAWACAVLVFAAAFLAPGLAPESFRNAWRALRQNHQTIATKETAIELEDDLQVARERDYYRLLDANHPQLVESIPSQLAREVVIERERVRYQSMGGAWRHSFRAEQAESSPWTGAGFLRGRSTSGDPTFVRAARSDYVYPTYVRAEFGSLGLIAIIALYVSLFAAATASLDGFTPSRLAIWSSAIGVGTALFMIGGTARLFPFSGKWPLFLSFASSSDIALGIALLALTCVEEEA
jgi:cell division protein FtsW (lipid II flippase)